MGRWRRGRRRDATAADPGSWRNATYAWHPTDLVRRPIDGEYVALRPAPGGRLANGLVIDASIVARLLGLRLLTLDARIRLVPTQVATESSPPPTGSSARPSNLHDATDLLVRASQSLDQVSQDLGRTLTSIHDQDG